MPGIETHYGLQLFQLLEDLRFDFIIHHAAIFIILEAGICGDRETERHGQTDLGHLCQVRAFSSKEVLHILGALIE